MDQFLKELQSNTLGFVLDFSTTDLLLALFGSAILSIIVSLVYRKTHSGLSYSRSFVFSIIIMAVTVSFIMLIIGSNLARAFSLVGALSIVRYRNAIKDSQDISYIFMSIAIGMACGTKLLEMAVIFTAFSSALMLLLNKYSFGNEGNINKILYLTFDENSVDVDALERFLGSDKNLKSSLMSSETIGEKNTLIFDIETRKDHNFSELLSNLKHNFGSIEVKFVTGIDRFNV